MPIQGPADRATGVKTQWVNVEGWNVLAYRGTPVIKYNDNVIVLDTGGFRTQTTKRRMNQGANERNLGFEVKQIKGEWYVIRGDEKLLFVNDTFTIER